MKSYEIALIPGDGIGVDVTEAAWSVLTNAAAGAGFALEGTTFPWSCAFYEETGAMMPADGIATLRKFDAILLGAVGWPARVPDSVSLHGLLLPIRKSFVQYANIRPHRLLAGVEGPLKKTDFDILCIRENTEGEYSGAGGRVHQGTSDEVAVETSIFTRTAVERILRFGFEQARKRRGKLASVTKSNAQKYSMVFWDAVTAELAAEYPDVEVTGYHIDAMAARMVMAPESLDVVLENLLGVRDRFGKRKALYEPVHGSAPDIAHLGIANPIAAIWSGAMMLHHLGEAGAAKAVMGAIEAATARGIGTVPGQNKTSEITAAVLAALA